MARILTPEPSFPGKAAQADSTRSVEGEAGEFEVVLGRRQMASVAFLGLIVLAVFTGGSYLIGKGIAINASAAELPAVPAAPVPPALPTALESPPPPIIEKPLHANPIKGVIYIQMGAVENGIAEILSEGLRKRGFESFVAPGPSDKIFRVLIGPFGSADEYQAAQDALNRIGLQTFARRYEE